jgi:hypothetical protein
MVPRGVGGPAQGDQHGHDRFDYTGGGRLRTGALGPWCLDDQRGCARSSSPHGSPDATTDWLEGAACVEAPDAVFGPVMNAGNIPVGDLIAALGPASAVTRYSAGARIAGHPLPTGAPREPWPGSRL